MKEFELEPGEHVVKEVRKHCIDKDMDISEFIEHLIKKELK